MAATSRPANALLPPGFDVQGHRGARGLQPENTLPAFETALDLGVSTLELDLHLTADGEVVIWHDDAIPATKCVAQHYGRAAPAARPRRSRRRQAMRYISPGSPLPTCSAIAVTATPTPTAFPTSTRRRPRWPATTTRSCAWPISLPLSNAMPHSDAKSAAQRANAASRQLQHRDQAQAGRPGGHRRRLRRRESRPLRAGDRPHCRAQPA